MKARLLDSVVVEGVFARSYVAYGFDEDGKSRNPYHDSKMVFRFIPFSRNESDTISSSLELLKIPKQESGYIFATYKDTDLTYGIKEEVKNELFGFDLVDSLFMNATWFEVYKGYYSGFVFVKVVFYKYLYFNKNLGYLTDYVYSDILQSRNSYEVFFPKRLLKAKEIISFPMQIPF